MKSISLSPARLLGLSLLFVLAIAGCQKENSSQPNDGLTTTLPTSVKVYLTDDQSLVFDKVFIDLQKLEIKIEDDGVDSVDGWFSLNITPGIYDILQFRNGLDTLFATGTIPANRKLQKIRLTLGNNNSVEKDGKTYPLIVKDKDNEVIAKLESSNVEFTSPDQFMFWIDFDAGRSIRKNNSGSGNNNGFELRSQIRIFTKSKSGRIEGRVLPAAANAIVMAINGTDTATAKPEREGEFKIVGLKAGTYQMFIDATSNNYKDTVLNNVVVRHNEDTKLGTIVLRQ
jgi:hypothetical protein